MIVEKVRVAGCVFGGDIFDYIVEDSTLLDVITDTIEGLGSPSLSCAFLGNGNRCVLEGQGRLILVERLND
jgi:hypothetical protein